RCLRPGRGASKMPRRTVWLRLRLSESEQTASQTAPSQIGPEKIDASRNFIHTESSCEKCGLGLVDIGTHRFAEAESYLDRAATLMETVLPPDHPDRASVWANLGVVYTAQGRYRQAELVLQKALALQVRVLGPDHPANYWTLKGYASLLRI